MSGESVLVPEGWRGVRGLACGFGSRTFAPERATTVRQVHGKCVVEADDLEHTDHDRIEADALVVTADGACAAVKTADCVPVLLVAPEHRWAAAVHAGWRGTVAGIVAATIEAAVQSHGIEPAEMLAAVGPAIGSCCYEVGEEVASRFADAGLAVERGGGEARLDLRAINCALLVAAGLRPERVQLCGPCTRCRSDLYYSYRADPSENGRQLSWVGWEARKRRADR